MREMMMITKLDPVGCRKKTYRDAFCDKKVPADIRCGPKTMYKALKGLLALHFLEEIAYHGQVRYKVTAMSQKAEAEKVDRTLDERFRRGEELTGDELETLQHSCILSLFDLSEKIEQRLITDVELIFPSVDRIPEGAELIASTETEEERKQRENFYKETGGTFTVNFPPSLEDDIARAVAFEKTCLAGVAAAKQVREELESQLKKRKDKETEPSS